MSVFQTLVSLPPGLSLPFSSFAFSSAGLPITPPGMPATTSDFTKGRIVQYRNDHPTANKRTTADHFKISRRVVASATGKVWSRKAPASKLALKNADRDRLIVRLAVATHRVNGRLLPKFPSLRRIATELKRKHNIKCSKTTVAVVLKSKDFAPRSRPKVPTQDERVEEASS